MPTNTTEQGRLLRDNAMHENTSSVLPDRIVLMNSAVSKRKY